MILFVQMVYLKIIKKAKIKFELMIRNNKYNSKLIKKGKTNNN